jgi:glycine/D-amino acid oxidase-like deaminating enzyme
MAEVSSKEANFFFPLLLTKKDTLDICIRLWSKKRGTRQALIPLGEFYNEEENNVVLSLIVVSFMVIATDKDRQFEYRKIAAFNRKFGVPVEEISAAEVKRKFPLARTDDILSGFFVEGDGRANPVDVAEQGRETAGRESHRKHVSRKREDLGLFA